MAHSRRSTKERPNAQRSLLIACLFGGWAGVGHAGEAYYSGESLTYSEPTSIHSFLHEWNGEFNGGNYAFSYNSAELGIRDGALSVGALVRYDYVLTFSPDTADFYNATANDIELDPSKRYDLNIKANHFTAAGVRVSRKQAIPYGWTLHTGISLLYAWDLLSGDLHGTVDAANSDHMTFNASADYYYRDDPLFKRQASPPDGQGATLDLALEGDIGAVGHLNLRVTDVFGAIWWQSAPHTSATAQSTTPQSANPLESDIPPLISGREDYRDYRQDLQPRARLEATAHITPRYDASLGILYTSAATHYSLGLVRNSGQSATAVRYNLSAAAFEIEQRYENLRIAAGADSLNYKAAHYLFLAIKYVRSF